MLDLLVDYSRLITESCVNGTSLRLLSVCEESFQNLSTLLFIRMRDLEFIIYLLIVYPLDQVLSGAAIMLGRIPEGWAI